MNEYKESWMQHCNMLYDNTQPIQLQELQEKESTLARDIAIAVAVRFVPAIGTAMAIYSIYDFLVD